MIRLKSTALKLKTTETIFNHPALDGHEEDERGVERNHAASSFADAYDFAIHEASVVDDGEPVGTDESVVVAIVFHRRCDDSAGSTKR